MVTSEYVGRPRRWATGIEAVPRTRSSTRTARRPAKSRPSNPFPEGNRMMLAEAHESKFGQLEAAEPRRLRERRQRVCLGQVMAVSALPAHYCGVTAPTSPPSPTHYVLPRQPDRAEPRRGSSSSADRWEDVARLIVAVRDGVDPLNVDVRVKWADASTRSRCARGRRGHETVRRRPTPGVVCAAAVGLHRRRNRRDSHRPPHRGARQRRRRPHKAGVMSYQDELIALADSSDRQVQVVYAVYLSGQTCRHRRRSR